MKAYGIEKTGKIFLLFVALSLVYTTFGQNKYFKIVGGAVTRKGRWPWQAMVIGRKRNIQSVFSCGATLISSNFLLTSAYCPMGFYQIQVILGLWNFTAEYEEGRLNYGVSNIIPHPCFDGQVTNSDADVALIRIKPHRKFGFPSTVSAACLPTTPHQDWDNLVHDGDITNCIATGYGVGPNRRASLGVLNEVEFPFLSKLKCQQVYGNLLSEDKMCSYGAPGRSTCKGDMGGPIVCPNINSDACEGYYLAGTISNTASNCDSPQNNGMPSIFTAIFPHLDWIRSVIRNQRRPPLFSCRPQITEKSNALNEYPTENGSSGTENGGNRTLEDGDY